MGRKHHRSGKATLATLIDNLLKVSTTPHATQPSKALEVFAEIHTILEEIIRYQSGGGKSGEGEAGSSSSSSSSVGGGGDVVDSRESAARCFTDWVRGNGAVFDGASIATFDGYDFGIKAEMDMEKDSLVIAVPRNLMMTIETAAKSPLGFLMEKDHILSSMQNVALAMFLLVEKFKGAASFWKPYIDLLPQTYTTVLYFDVGEMGELQGSPTLEVAVKQVKSIARQFAYFYKLVATSDDPASRILKGRFTYEEYRWAVSTVMTRQNMIPSKCGSKEINALIPLWDLCNHASGFVSTDYNPELDRSECLALRDFKAGEQFFIFYGPRPNAEFFIHNGFVCEDNTFDCYWLRLGVSKSDPLHNKRVELLNKIPLPSSGEFCIRYKTEPIIPGYLVAFLLVFHMSEADLDKWLAETDLSPFENLNCKEESLTKKSWNFLLARLKLLLATYKTTLEQDEEIIAKKEGTANKLLAIRMRASEKRVLKNALDYVQKNIKE